VYRAVNTPAPKQGTVRSVHNRVNFERGYVGFNYLCSVDHLACMEIISEEIFISL
jgi:hypothetical protein